MGVSSRSPNSNKRRATGQRSSNEPERNSVALPTLRGKAAQDILAGCGCLVLTSQQADLFIVARSARSWRQARRIGWGIRAIRRRRKSYPPWQANALAPFGLSPGKSQHASEGRITFARLVPVIRFAQQWREREAETLVQAQVTWQGSRFAEHGRTSQAIAQAARWGLVWCGSIRGKGVSRSGGERLLTTASTRPPYRARKSAASRAFG